MTQSTIEVPGAAYFNSINTWPFGDMPDSELFRSDYTGYINPGSGQTTAVVLGQPYRLGTDRTSVAIDYDLIPGVKNPNTDLHVALDTVEEDNLDSAQAAIWKQLLGVRIAMEVATVPTSFSSGMRRYVRPLKIMGIEQPYKPDVSEPREPGSSAFVHGLVVGRTETGPRQYRLHLDLGEHALATQIDCSSPHIRALPDIDGPLLPEAGDRVRVRGTVPEVGRGLTADFQDAVYILGR